MSQIKAVASGHSGSSITIATAPARLDVLGGLSLEAGGVVAQMALPNRAGVALQWRNDGKIIFMGRQHRQRRQPVILPSAAIFSTPKVSHVEAQQEIAELHAAWIAPLLQVFRTLTRRGFTASSFQDASSVCGATVVVESDIRPLSGQAGATAVTAALLQAITSNRGIALTAIQKARIISEAQRTTTGSHGHVVD
ncbi:MAG: hypothetical protein ACP5VQ_01175, partial [Phycisphaerae bacterium]